MKYSATDHSQMKEVWMSASCSVVKENVVFLWRYIVADFFPVYGVWHKAHSSGAF